MVRLTMLHNCILHLLSQVQHHVPYNLEILTQFLFSEVGNISYHLHLKKTYHLQIIIKNANAVSFLVSLLCA
jgi:hypothetical protein